MNMLLPATCFQIVKEEYIVYGCVKFTFSGEHYGIKNPTGNAIVAMALK